MAIIRRSGATHILTPGKTQTKPTGAKDNGPTTLHKHAMNTASEQGGFSFGHYARVFILLGTLIAQ